MCLIPTWNMFEEGIVVSIIGILILLCIIPVYRKKHPKNKKNIDLGIIATFIIGTLGALVLGFAMSKVMTPEVTKTDMIIGLITGIIGLITCILNYPIYAYIKGNK